METQWGDSNEEPRLPDPDEYVKYLSEMPYDLPWSYENPDTLQAEYESIRRRWLLPLVVIWLVVLIVGLVIGITQSGGWSLVGFLLVPTTVIGAAITYIVVENRSHDIRSRLTDAREREAQEQARTGRRKKPEATDYFAKIVNINIQNLERYYGLVKRHTDNAFFVALGVGVAGFSLITVGLAIGFTRDEDSERVVAYIATASGVITEFIAGVFFYLYNRTTRQLKEYHDSLLEVQDLLLSFRIVKDSGGEDRPDMMKTMLNALLRPKRFRMAVEADASVAEHSPLTTSRP